MTANPLPPPASYLVTFRDRDGTRRPLLDGVLDWLSTMPSLQVIVVEQDDAPRLDAGAMPGNARHVFAFNDGPFNKSWGLNVAARLACHDLLILGDADMLMTGETLSRSLVACAERFDAVNPYERLIDLDDDQTRACLAGTLDLESTGSGARRDRVHDGEQLCFCGGICVFRRNVYFALGGMDERFFGWGGEDDAMSINLRRHTDRLAVQRGAVAYHLWHPRPASRYTHAHYAGNLEQLKRWFTDDEARLAERRAEQAKTMGDPKRFLRKH